MFCDSNSIELELGIDIESEKCQVEIDLDCCELGLNIGSGLFQ